MAQVVRSAALKQATAAFRLSRPAARPVLSLAAKSIARGGLRQSIIKPACFHTTSRRDILPPPPQQIQGSVNDPAPVPPPSPSHGSYHWTFERLIAAGLVPLTIVPFASGSGHPTLDAVLCALIVIHSHLGFQAIIIDYIPKKRMPGIRKLFTWGLNAATALVAVGLYEFETTDVGVTEAVARLWHA